MAPVIVASVSTIYTILVRKRRLSLETQSGIMGSQKIHLALLLFIWASLACLSSSLPTELSISGEELASEEKVREFFHLWKEKHKRVYKHEEETAKRFEIFKENLKYVIEKNSKAKTSEGGHRHLLGMNRFADMSNEEFKQKYLSKLKKPIGKRNNNLRRSMQQKKAAMSCEAPSSLDWRKKGVVTAVKDQGDCGTSSSSLHFFDFMNKRQNTNFVQI